MSDQSRDHHSQVKQDVIDSLNAPDSDNEPSGGELPPAFDRLTSETNALDHLLTEPDPLTDDQTLAVLASHEDRDAILVRAGPGSGKTTVIVRRYIYCLLRGTSVSDLLCVTFTRRAAREMKNRIIQQLESLLTLDTEIKHKNIEHMLALLRDGRDWITTFHSAASRLLTDRLNGEETPLIEHVSGDYDANFDFLGADDRRRFIETLLENNGWSRSTTVRRIEELINEWRVNLIPPSEAMRTADSDVDYISARIFQSLRKHKESNGLMDYMDLIYHLGQTMRRDRDIRRDVARRFDYVMIDEFQDTNPAQQMMISNIVKHGGRLYAVGDEKQAIYGWRGANFEMMRDFDQSFTDCQVISLGVNFRSRALITLTTNVLAEECGINDDDTMDPPTSSDGLDYGDPPGLFEADTGEEEKEFIVHYVEKLNDSTCHDFSDIGILVRLNRQKRRIRRTLQDQSIPINELGGSQFFDRSTTQVFLACLRCLRTMYESQYKPSEELSGGLSESWYDWALSESGPLESSHEDLLRGIESPDNFTGLAGDRSLSTGVDSRFTRSFQQSVDTLREIALELHRGRYLPDFLDALKRDCFGVDNRMVGDHLRECVSWAKQNVRYDGYRGLVSLLNCSKFQELDPQFSARDDSDGVVLSTIHGAKGMEFPVVVIPGLEEGWLPHTEDPSGCDLAEEMRLLYVAMTRAKEDLVLCCARSRETEHGREERQRSRFIERIPDEFLQVRKRRGCWPDWLRAMIESLSVS